MNNVFGVMFAVLFAAKIFGAITWSWWLVTAPIWAPLVLFLVVLIFAAIVGVK